MSEQSLKDKTVKGTAWSAADTFISQGVRFIVGIVLARLLSPSEYGIIGLVTIFIAVLTCLVDGGFSNALIRKKNTTNNDYCTLFLTNLVVSILLYILLFFSAHMIATFFKTPELVALIRAMGVVLIIQALTIVQTTILAKQIDFKTKTKASVLAAVVSGVVGIAMAYCGMGVWALVGQQLSNVVIYTIVLWTLNRWYPRLVFEYNSFKYMWGFGWKLMLSSLLNNIWNQLYQVVVGKFYSPSTLGQYTRSREYANIFSSNVTSIVQRVSFPVLADIQDDKQRMLQGYRRIIRVTMFITAICMICMAAVAEPLIYCLIGTQWHQAATFLPLICISMSLYPLHAINLNMLQVQGRSDIYLVLEIIKKVIAIGPICLGIFVDIYWMLVGSIITGFIAFFLNTYYTGRSLNYSSWKQLKDVAPSYMIAVIIGLSVYFFKFCSLSYFIVLFIQIIVGGCVFFAINELLKLEEYLELKSIVRKVALVIKVKLPKKTK